MRLSTLRNIWKVSALFFFSFDQPVDIFFSATQPMLLSDEDDEDDSNSVYSNDSAP